MGSRRVSGGEGECERVRGGGGRRKKCERMRGEKK